VRYNLLQEKWIPVLKNGISGRALGAE
jgi:hypothetical protein